MIEEFKSMKYSPSLESTISIPKWVKFNFWLFSARKKKLFQKSYFWNNLPVIPEMCLERSTYIHAVSQLMRPLQILMSPPN
jgi:hypothetical protein